MSDFIQGLIEAQTESIKDPNRLVMPILLNVPAHHIEHIRIIGPSDDGPGLILMPDNEQPKPATCMAGPHVHPDGTVCYPPDDPEPADHLAAHLETP